MLLAVSSILIAYAIGSISSAYVVGKLLARYDMRGERDGNISAAAVYQKFGRVPFIVVVLMDIGLAICAITVARVLTNSRDVMMLAGLAAVAGHNWSVFLKFKGGLGATAMGGVLGTLMLQQLFLGLGVAVIVFLFTFKPGLSSAVALIATSTVVWIQTGFGTMALLPLGLLALMIIKRSQLTSTEKVFTRSRIIFRRGK
jgi:glycerol-3-phosphate acyltransferase PlsY